MILFICCIDAQVAALAWACLLGVGVADTEGGQSTLGEGQFAPWGAVSALWGAPVVTVVITTFNRPVMLRQAVHSVLQQARASTEHTRTHTLLNICFYFLYIT
jgi:hypothetical protein